MKLKLKASPRLILSGRLIGALSVVLLFVGASLAADAPRVDPRYPFRTDFANAQLPWYMPKPGEFPPHHSDRRVGGELISIDSAYRSGKFRRTKNGDVVEFTMPPYGSVNYLYSDAELSDVPLGTFFLFFLNQDPQGNFTRLATMQDQFTMDAGHGFSYTVNSIDLPEGRMAISKHSVKKSDTPPSKQDWVIDDKTRVWKGDQQVKVSDLAVGDEILFNFTDKVAQQRGRCTDIWIGADTAKLATERERKLHAAFIEARGLPAWIDSVDGSKIVATLFTGDPGTFHQTYMGDFAIGKAMKIVAADDLLEVANPPINAGATKLLSIHQGPVDAYGTSGVQLTFTVSNTNDAFSKGHIIRVFAPSWMKRE